MLIRECARCARCTGSSTLIPRNGRRRRGRRALNRAEEKFRWRRTHFGAVRSGRCDVTIGSGFLDLSQSGINFADKAQPGCNVLTSRQDARQRKTFSAISSAVEHYDVYLPTVHSSEALYVPLSLFFFPFSLFSNQSQFFSFGISPLLASSDCLERACEATKLIGGTKFIHSFRKAILS